MICPECGKVHNKSYTGLCQSCYNYFRNGGKVYDLPPKGFIMHGDDGKVICHICGRAYVRLGSHIRESHNMTINQYKKIYGLNYSAKTTEASYSAVMRENAYKNGMVKQLTETGINTRIKPGDTLRKGKSCVQDRVRGKQNAVRLLNYHKRCKDE